jgi:hypothetical protein
MERTSGTKASKNTPDGAIAELRTRIDGWRRTRSKRNAMPKELWADAVSLCDGRGLYAVARGLGISYDRLKMRTLEAELARQAGTAVPVEDAHATEVAVASFVELSAAQLFSASANHMAGTEVELARPDGARMTIRMAVGQTVDVRQLSQTFLGGVS